MKANTFKKCKHYMEMKCCGIKTNICTKHDGENCRLAANPEVGCDDLETETKKDE
ncbi:MAG: hypothetical protein K2N48_01355 [Muribaculaceae bacterium]|nr:hypothetical protein [Muribaculaceae bacterium]